MMQKILSYLRRAVDDYNMIEDGDKIAVGVSGGKDSLTLLVALANLRRFYPKSFSLEAISLEVNPVQDPGEVAQIQEKPQEELQENPQPQKEDETALQSAVLPEEPKNANRWLVWALVAAVAVLAVVLFIILFKEQFAQMVRDLLYTEEELQIIEQWKQGYTR